MRKRAFTLFEITLVIAILAVLAAGCLPYMLKTFGGFNDITMQADMVNTLQEISTVITRRIVSDREGQPTTLNLDYINRIINDMALEIDSGNYKMHNNIIIKKLVKNDIENRSNNNFKTNVNLPHNCLRITLTAVRKSEQQKISFIVFPIFN